MISAASSSSTPLPRHPSELSKEEKMDVDTPATWIHTPFIHWHDSRRLIYRSAWTGAFCSIEIQKVPDQGSQKIRHSTGYSDTTWVIQYSSRRELDLGYQVKSTDQIDNDKMATTLKTGHYWDVSLGCWMRWTAFSDRGLMEHLKGFGWLNMSIRPNSTSREGWRDKPNSTSGALKRWFNHNAVLDVLRNIEHGQHSRNSNE